MLDLRIKEYLSQIGIRKVNELDTALLEAFGADEGERHIGRLTELFDQSEERLLYGTGDSPYLRRQEELVDYLNQSLKMSLLAASFYDNVFFRRVMEYLLKFDFVWGRDIFDIGSGNGILTCFLAKQHPDSVVTGVELSSNAALVAEELAGRLQVNNVRFTSPKASGQKKCDTLFSCRTVHENIAWRTLEQERKSDPLTMEELIKRYGEYAKNLAGLVKDKGYLVSVEHYENDNAHTGLVRAMEYEGFCQVKGTYMQFQCRNGDSMAAFQAMIFQKMGE